MLPGQRKVPHDPGMNGARVRGEHLTDYINGVSREWHFLDSMKLTLWAARPDGINSKVKFVKSTVRFAREGLKIRLDPESSPDELYGPFPRIAWSSTRELLRQEMIVLTQKPYRIIPTKKLIQQVNATYPEWTKTMATSMWEEEKRLPALEDRLREEAIYRTDVCMAKTEDRSPVGFEPFWKLRSAAPPQIGGFESEKRAIMALGVDYFKGFFGELPLSVLLFGLPGVGKSSVARLIAWWMNQNGHPVSLVTVPCHQLVSRYAPDDMMKQLRLVEQSIEEHQPSIVFIDEGEGIGSNLVRLTAGELSLRHWTMSLMGAKGKKAIVLFATNIVETLDLAIRQRFTGGKIYFDLPLIHDINDILRTLGILDHEQVSKIVYNRAESMKEVLTPRNLTQGVQASRNYFADKEVDFDRLPPNEQASSIIRWGGERIKQDEAKIFTAKYRLDIQDAIEGERAMLMEFDRLVKKGDIRL